MKLSRVLIIFPVILIGIVALFAIFGGKDDRTVRPQAVVTQPAPAPVIIPVDYDDDDDDDRYEYRSNTWIEADGDVVVCLQWLGDECINKVESDDLYEDMIGKHKPKPGYVTNGKPHTYTTGTQKHVPGQTVVVVPVAPNTATTGVPGKTVTTTAAPVKTTVDLKPAMAPATVVTKINPGSKVTNPGTAPSNSPFKATSTDGKAVTPLKGGFGGSAVKAETPTKGGFGASAAKSETPVKVAPQSATVTEASPVTEVTSAPVPVVVPITPLNQKAAGEKATVVTTLKPGSNASKPATAPSKTPFASTSSKSAPKPVAKPKPAPKPKPKPKKSSSRSSSKKR